MVAAGQAGEAGAVSVTPPTTLAFSFPWGRYHANPWGRHVNEAVVEWPPSPWRILRALYATWRARAAHLDEQVVHDLLAQLAAPPSFVLPESGVGHTRHYMPDTSHRKGNPGGTDKAFDTFTVFEPDAAILASWPVTLVPAHAAALAELASLLPYLGRADSICQVHVVDGPPSGGVECRPVAVPDGDEVPAVRVLVPTEPLDLAALTARTNAVRAARLVDPPGSRWQLYSRPRSADVHAPAVARQQTRRPTVVRWSLATSARPSMHAAVAVADILRQACMARYGRRFDGRTADVLAGKNLDGIPLKHHRHAHYLCIDTDGDRLADCVVAWAPAGFDEATLSAMCELDRLTGFGHISDFRPARLGLEAIGAVDVAVPELIGPARVWTTHTPFAPTRHWKRRQSWSDAIRDQITVELVQRGFPPPTDVEILGGDWLRYRRHRPTTERLVDARRATGVRLRFDSHVLGPMSLGALSHFGLGLFLPTP